MLIDFKEIPVSKGTGTTQDVFEKFSRDFLELMGYEIISGPARGADGGIDIKVLEKRKGVGGVTEIYWLVSCKHYAHSGKSITKEIEQDIRDRVEKHGCNGFIGLYTTIANQSLLNSLEALSNKIEYQLFDNEKIEKHIVGVHSNENMFIRFFPESYKRWKDLYYYTEPIKLFSEFLEKKYSSEIKLYLMMFHSVGNLIKQLRKYDDLKTAIENENVKYFIVSEFSEKYDEKEGVRKAMVNRVQSFFQRVFAVENYNEKYTVFAAGANEILYVRISNYLLVSRDYHNALSDIFKDLKQSLN